MSGTLGTLAIIRSYVQLCLEERTPQVLLQRVLEPLLVVLDQVAHLCDLLLAERDGLCLSGLERLARSSMDLRRRQSAE